MAIIHNEYDFNGQIKEIDEIFALTGEKVPRFHYLPSQEEIGDLKLFVSVCAVVYLHIRPKQDASVASFGESVTAPKQSVVTFRQRVSIQQTFINVMREHAKCFDFMFFGDDMVCVLDTTFQPDVNELFEQLAKLNSMLSILNRKSQLAGLTAIEWGIGAHYGEVFVSVQRHHTNDIRYNWSGLAFQITYDLSLTALNDGVDTIYTTDVFYQNLKDKYKDLMHKKANGFYSASIINRPIKDWQTDNLDNQ